MITAYKILCYCLAMFFVALGSMLFWPMNAIPWMAYGLMLVIIEIFVIGLVLPERRWKGPGSGAFDVIGGHAAVLVATGAFVWPSWEYSLLSLIAILLIQFMPGARTQAAAMLISAVAIFVLERARIPSSHAWVYSTVAWSNASMLVIASILRWRSRTEIR